MACDTPESDARARKEVKIMYSARHNLVDVTIVIRFMIGLLFFFGSNVMSSVDGEYGNYAVVETASSVRVEELINKAVSQRVIFVGESHSSVEDHMLQYKVLQAMVSSKRSFSIGVEWFQQPFQPALDDYIAGNIDENELLRRTEYYKRWSFDYRLYRPIMRFARKHGIRVLALNASRELTDTIMKSGIEALPDKFREQLPSSYDFEESEYTRLLNTMFGKPDEDAHPLGGGFQRFLEVQLTWDETMAERAARFLDKHKDSSLLIFAGRGHTHLGAIPARVTRRTGIKGISLLNFQANTPFNSADYLILAEEQQLPPQAIIGVMIQEQDDGVYVSGFSKDSHAASAGIQANDRILAIDDNVVKTLVDLKLSLIDMLPGDEVSLLLLRQQDAGERSLKVTLKLTARDAY
jgi:uncharacterized iron-regulated protein